MRRSLFVTAVAAGVVGSVILASIQPSASAHCEVPCGIYTDHARIDQMLEDATTVSKATGQIIALSKEADALSLNQATRWVVTKEEHATRIQNTIAQYFLTQRVKPKDARSDEWDDYVKRLTEHHAVMVAAMKTKQTVDPIAVATLRQSIERIARYYPAPDAREHEHGRGHDAGRGG
ncbi:MAG: superoxide dismutase [Planctomycetes bacterium]|nr:superoxide dismutase [Planctomycetota bacterium]